jgi:hypothetical protein
MKNGGTFRGIYRSPKIINPLATAPGYYNLPPHSVATDTLLTLCNDFHIVTLCNGADAPWIPSSPSLHRSYGQPFYGHPKPL